MPKDDFNIDFSPYWSLQARITPLQHLIKEMRQKTEYVTKLLYNRVLNSN